MIAIYPGSFDPITLGHLDIIERGCRLFEQVIVAVLRNSNKTPLFTMQERLDQIRLSTQHLTNLEVDSFDGLTVNYAQMRQAQVLLRGLRVLSDFEAELQMANTNKTLSTQVETIFLATSNEYSFLSSSLVKRDCQVWWLRRSSCPSARRPGYLPMLRQDSPHIEPNQTQPEPFPSGSGGMDVQRELNRLEEIVLASPHIPLTRRTLVDEEQLLDPTGFSTGAFTNRFSGGSGYCSTKTGNYPPSRTTR